jgi:hypothetical protein
MRRTICGAATALTLSIAGLVVTTTAVQVVAGFNERDQHVQVVAGFNEPDQHD